MGKSNILLLLLPLLISVILAEDDIASKFEIFEIVPDVLKEIPKNLIKVSIKYPSGVEVNYGNELTPTQVKDIPSVTWDANVDDYYTLLMIDPDAPSRQDHDFAEVKHWLVVNIPGTTVDKGEIIAEYIGSGPPEDTDLHRYIFLIYSQPNGKIDFSKEPKSDKETARNRFLFSTAEFTKKYSLELIGGNFYQAQYDEYVTILLNQFKDM
uniref:Putative phosphatidylethanolamine-binding protein n=1 Tax=Nyssomyia neivai TaxID=330878 RepID=A0A1L8DPV4_9DIPT